ncbi:L,D-transpeptidase family protein [Rubrivirga litoralis]|uniref:L,D-transpeptidase family protein n=1 Tax=Rubrivirga litoralis TaxID=3075598 RepID=A0ABU3BNQ5_9BACT|nr:L,D-transpeptidase family protein [Rubrivirga sp. F394]MDT0630929.1 L,D-transpeptidase family protein [Rubrivirga sp. F394]
MNRLSLTLFGLTAVSVLVLTLLLVACGDPAYAATPPPATAAPASGAPADSTVPARQRLEEALARYQQVAQGGGWSTVPDGDLVEPGDTAATQVQALRDRLAASGELGGADPAGDVYDGALVGALARFQATHGLAVDSLLGGNTRAALNESADRRVEQIQSTLARWDELPAFPTGPDARYVVVNVPEFRVRAFEGGREALQMEVVVGASYDGRETPLFHDKMEHVIFRPYWGVPASIASEELVSQGPSALEGKGFEIAANYNADAEVYPMTWANLRRVGDGELRIRQTPGPDNALGLVKYMFPNQHAVYLHDTPADHLFEEADRAFSHGCIRLERPAEFGAWVLGPQGWDEARVRENMTTGDREKVVLDEEIPVYIVYLPVWADAGGAVHFAQDVYDEIN